MSDWAVGDLAVCVDASPCPHSPWLGSCGLVEGRSYTVTGILPGSLWDRCEFGLTLAEIAPPAPLESYASDRFRKIRPDEHTGSADDWALILETAKLKVRA